jgi:hypothetical protein
LISSCKSRGNKDFRGHAKGKSGSSHWIIEDKLSRRRMTWLLSPPLPPSPVSKLDRRHSGRLRKRDNMQAGEGRGKEPNHTTARKPGPLYGFKYSLGQTIRKKSQISLCQYIYESNFTMWITNKIKNLKVS